MLRTVRTSSRQARGASGGLLTIRRHGLPAGRGGRRRRRHGGWEGSPQGGESRSAQADLAQILGMSRSAVSFGDTGRVAWRIDELERVAWNASFPATDLLEKLKKARRLRSW